MQLHCKMWWFPPCTGPAPSPSFMVHKMNNWPKQYEMLYSCNAATNSASSFFHPKSLSCLVTNPPTEPHRNLTSRFCLVLLANKPYSSGENITHLQRSKVRDGGWNPGWTPHTRLSVQRVLRLRGTRFVRHDIIKRDRQKLLTKNVCLGGKSQQSHTCPGSHGDIIVILYTLWYQVTDHRTTT